VVLLTTSGYVIAQNKGFLMFRRSLRKGAAAAALSLLISGGAAAAVSSPASAATVPNRFYCNPNGGWCYQVNGGFVPGIVIECHWKRSGMSGKPRQIYYTSCQRWGSDVP